MAFSVELAKIQGQRLLEEEEDSRLAALCVCWELPLPVENESVCVSLPEMIEGGRAYSEKLRTEIMERRYKKIN